MQAPRVNPVGLVEHPQGYVSRPRGYPVGLRWVAALLLGSFLSVGVVTTVYSLARFCLTSHAGSPPFLPS